MKKLLSLLLAISPIIAEAQTFDNCTQDCSGHLAGYRWAERNNIVDESDCYGGKSRSFIEGCVQYVREMEREWQIEMMQPAEESPSWRY